MSTFLSFSQPQAMRFRAGLARMHSIAGIFVAPLLIVATVSGFFYALAPSIEKIVYREQLTASSTHQAQPLSAQIAAAQKVHPELSFAGIQVSDNPRDTTRVLFHDPRLPSPSYTQAVFVDPGDLAIKGDLVQYGSSRALPIRTWLSQGHRNLWLGDLGRLYSETAASWLGMLSILGLFLWLSTKKQKKDHTRPLSQRKRLVTAHSRLGLWLLPIFLFLTITGLTWSLVAGNNIALLRTQLNWVEPKPVVALDEIPAGASCHEDHIVKNIESSPAEYMRVDDMVRTARQEHLKGILDIRIGEPEQAWTIKEARQPYKLANSTISVNPHTAQLVDKVNYADIPLAAKLTNWLIQLHMGMLFGLINQLVLAVAALGLLYMIFQGYRMWWHRGKNKKPGRLPQPVGLKNIPTGLVIAWTVFLLCYCALAPLFAASLLLFLLIDAAIRRIKRT
ncbi:PepSY domain-containing protein [Corynebacterium sp. SY003]|uniref:PepSY-associated TM helix domain-containing protein n=2 Tax=unclassified Corynebacterium TaxID=2624378 RepID=UPI0021076605|nr:PepSY-associated TM helix domain-containing protein [Corynebacterium sp. SY003]